MNSVNFEKTILELRKIAKRNTRDKSKKQFDEELFEGQFFNYIKEKEIDSSSLYNIAFSLMQGKDNFDKDMAIFIISSPGIPQKLISNFLEENLTSMNEEQTSSGMFLINKYQLKDLYYPLVNHLKLNLFFNSESFKKRLTYSGILFDKEEGYKEFQEALEHDLSITTLEEGNIELDIGNILFLFVANKNYEKIQTIFQRYSNRKTKDFLKQQTFIAAKRWNAGFKERFMIKKAIVMAQIKNLIKLI
ncbi:hypothetical protein LEP1GSC127_3390 [Leptospira kirschneri str. 200801925]|uniref:Uncharacterized protein n=1 Tax=Leptospira kirschneri str. 200802841 TaxID=1193047 RepID=A0A828Y2B6_9LEPT|nr:hypothetical protein [Leptospira kirschneri]EKO50301.1 hypothetical protein LEP1GSC131_3284 [Leptospira kirschneri str. 200802841]EMO74193.1 hypothetical protein LEP1GSC127_3390 [Leptospira kirschneri str. 200801925]